MLVHASNNPGVVLHRKVDVSYFSAVNVPVQTCTNVHGARHRMPLRASKTIYPSIGMRAFADSFVG
jgi:hypothetical protein